jgi:hypothetical protein
LDLLLTYRGAKIVQTRLCVAMASLLIHSIPGQWSNPVQVSVSKNFLSSSLKKVSVSAVPSSAFEEGYPTM